MTAEAKPEADNGLPTILYKAPGAHRGPSGDTGPSTYDWKEIKTKSALEGHLKAGWSATLPEAIAKYEKEKAALPPPASPGARSRSL